MIFFSTLLQGTKYGSFLGMLFSKVWFYLPWWTGWWSGLWDWFQKTWAGGAAHYPIVEHAKFERQPGILWWVYRLQSRQRDLNTNCYQRYVNLLKEFCTLTLKKLLIIAFFFTWKTQRINLTMCNCRTD